MSVISLPTEDVTMRAPNLLLKCFLFAALFSFGTVYAQQVVTIDGSDPGTTDTTTDPGVDTTSTSTDKSTSTTDSTTAATATDGGTVLAPDGSTLTKDKVGGGNFTG